MDYLFSIGKFKQQYEKYLCGAVFYRPYSEDKILVRQVQPDKQVSYILKRDGKKL